MATVNKTEQVCIAKVNAMTQKIRQRLSQATYVPTKSIMIGHTVYRITRIDREKNPLFICLDSGALLKLNDRNQIFKIVNTSNPKEAQQVSITLCKFITRHSI